MYKEQSNKNITLLSIIIRLLPLVFAVSPVFFIIFNLIGIIHGVSYGIITYTSQLFFDSVSHAISGSVKVSFVILMALALGAANIGTQVLNGLHNFLENVYFQKMNGYLGMYINRKASRLDPISYETPSMLDDINKANQGMSNSLGLLMTCITLFTFYLPYFLFMGIYLFKLKPILALSILLIFIPVALTQLVRGTVFAKLEDESAPIRREYEYYEKCICDREYFKETRTLGAFDFFRDLYQTALIMLGKKIWKAEYRTGLLELGMRMLTLLGYMGVLYLLFTNLLYGEISVGAFAAVFSSVGLMFGIMEEIICMHIGNLMHDLGTVTNFIRFLDLPERKGKDIKINTDGGIILDNVSFRYPGAEADSLTGISLEVRKGETIAIVGENGAGKTTLVKLMTGIYLPTEGSVRIGGVDTKDVSSASIYNGISGVFQKFQKYRMTLGENIEISDMSNNSKDVNEKIKYEEKLKNAVNKAALDLNDDSFKKGYDTMLSREFDGVDISGGQWQRVAIARGFYRAHDIIVLDEPTAAIDPIEETNIYRKFAEISKGKTSIIVTHRLGSAKIADRIIVMDKGRIVGIGTHDELMNLGKKYAEMFNAQAQWYVS